MKKIPKVERFCNNCGWMFYATQLAVSRGWGLFCSMDCKNKSCKPNEHEKLEEAIALYLAGKESLSAIGRRFDCSHAWLQSALKRRGLAARPGIEYLKGRVFSADWRAKIAANHHDVSGRKNPMFGKNPGHGKRIYVDHLGCKVRSEWEAVVALALQGQGVEHIYEPHRITFAHLSWLPDFFLPVTGLYIEVKGWLTNPRWLKVSVALAAEKPELRVLVISLEEMKLVRRDSASILSLIEAA